MEEAICFGWIDSKMTPLSNDSFLLRFTPRRVGGLWSKRNRDVAERLMSEGQMDESGLAAIDDAKKSGRWDSAYSSLTPPKVPLDLERALKSNVTAWERFQHLSNTGMLRYVIWVNEAKRPETRKKRIFTIVEEFAEYPG